MIRWLRTFGRKNSISPKEKKGEITEGLVLPFFTDLHSHLIPGIDDGVQEIGESLEILRGMEMMGYRRAILTPHVMQDSYRNSSHRIMEGLETLKRAVHSEGIRMELAAAAEYYMDRELLHRLKERDILCVGENHLLFETSYYTEPLNLEEMVYEIVASGYRPLMAHPERYRYVRDCASFYGRLRELGVCFQVNINSLGGFYGRDAREKAHWLKEQGWIDALGSDIHGRRHLEFHRKTVGSGILIDLLEKNKIVNDSFIVD